MEMFIRYILLSTSCLSILYLGYMLYQKNETRAHQLRYFLLLSIGLSVLMPFSTFRIDLNLSGDRHDTAALSKESGDSEILTDAFVVSNPDIDTPEGRGRIAGDLLIALYFTVLALFICRLLVNLFKILYLFRTSDRLKAERIVLLNTEHVSPFTFLNWIFVPRNIFMEDENIDIITHERIHASQYHSVDLILIELLSAVMWFNPLVWMMKKSVQLVHEYLADEGVLSTGTDRLGYQALLVNQVAEERLICLSSGFNHSLIKKRMIMMTKSKFNQGSKLRILVLIPLAAFLFAGVACVNGQKSPDVVTAVEPVRMNVLYIGVDNPVKIAASGYEASELTTLVDNGTITGDNGEYIIRPQEPGTAVVTVSSNGKEIQKTTFRVKVVPDPVAMVAGQSGGSISKQKLLEANEIVAVIENFEFDISFQIEEFTISTAIGGFYFEETSRSGKITDKQKGLIAKTTNGSKVYFEQIKYKGPDGVLRNVPPVALTITE